MRFNLLIGMFNALYTVLIPAAASALVSLTEKPAFLIILSFFLIALFFINQNGNAPFSGGIKAKSSFLAFVFPMLSCGITENSLS